MTGIPHAERPVDVGFVGASGCGLAVARAATVLTGAPDASAASSSALAVRIPRTPPALHEAVGGGGAKGSPWAPSAAIARRAVAATRCSNSAVQVMPSSAGPWPPMPGRHR